MALLNPLTNSLIGSNTNHLLQSSKNKMSSTNGISSYNILSSPIDYSQYHQASQTQTKANSNDIITSSSERKQQAISSTISEASLALENDLIRNILATQDMDKDKKDDMMMISIFKILNKNYVQFDVIKAIHNKLDKLDVIDQKFEELEARMNIMHNQMMVNNFNDKIKINNLSNIIINKFDDLSNALSETVVNINDNLIKKLNCFIEKINHKIENTSNNNNIILMNNINNLNGKLIEEVHLNEQLINNIINKMDETNEEKEQLVEILLNDINDIKASLNDHGNLQIKFIEKSKKMEKLINTSFEVHEINKNKMNEKLNDIINGYHNLEKNIEKKENKMAEIINNKFKKIENNKINQSSKVMVIKLDEMNKEILNIKNKINNNMNKLENINKNMVNMKNECKTSTFSNDAALQRMGKKLDNNNNNNNNKIRKINVKYKNKKNNKKNNNKHKNKNKNKKINNKNNNNKEDLVLINDNTIKASLDNNNNNKDDIIWGQKSNPIITRNKTLYGEKNKEENGIEFFIECTTFDNQYGGCTKGNIVCINIKNNDNGEFKVYAIIKWHDELIKKYVIPERGKDATTTHLNWFVLDRKPEDDERDIHFLNLKGKSLDNNICLNKLYMGKNIIL